MLCNNVHTVLCSWLCRKFDEILRKFDEILLKFDEILRKFDEILLKIRVKDYTCYISNNE